MDNLTEIQNIMIFWECDDHRAKLEGDRVVNGNVVEVFKQLLLSLLVKISKATSSEKQSSLETVGFIWDGPFLGLIGCQVHPAHPWGTADVKR